MNPSVLHDKLFTEGVENNMRKLKLYFDTTVVSYLYQNDSPEKMAETLALWEKIKLGNYDVCLSEVTIAEANACYEPKRTKLFEYIDEIEYTLIETDKNIVDIAQKFIDLKILTPKSIDDCRHIASAIAGGCDIIVSWNFRHIVNHKTIKGVKAITALEGFNDVLIYTPSYLLGGDDNDS